MRRVAVVAGVCLIGCAHSPHQLEFLPEENRAIAYPQGPGSYVEGRYQGDSSASQCAPFAHDSSSSVRTQVRVNPQYRVSLLLPSAWSQRMTPAYSAAEFKDGEVLVGLWEARHPSAVTSRLVDRDLAVWGGRASGFPSTALAVDTRQVAFEECRLSRDGHLAAFTVADHRGNMIYYVIAYWKTADMWVGAIGFGSDSLATNEIKAVFASFESMR
jgi:hypothetical protein